MIDELSKVVLLLNMSVISQYNIRLATVVSFCNNFIEVKYSCVCWMHIVRHLLTSCSFIAKEKFCSLKIKREHARVGSVINRCQLFRTCDLPL